MNAIDMLANDNYIIANKTIARMFGLDEAILLGELASEYRYWAKRDELKDGFFYSTVDNVKENTTLSDKRQRSAITTLKSNGILDVKLSGLPAKRYIKINTEQLLPILDNSISQNGITRSAEMADLDTANWQTNNNNINNNNKNNNKEYIEMLVAYLNLKAGTSYRANTPKTQQLIRARMAEGFTVDDIKAVIDKKCAEWKGTDMEKYIRPETLFGTKFDGYLNAKQSTSVRKTGANGIVINSESSELDDIF